MAECHNCGAQVANNATACPECGVQFANQQGQRQQGQPQQGQPQQGRPPQGQQQQMTDGGGSSSVVGILIGVLSIIYSLLNLLLTGTFLLGASLIGAAGSAAQETGTEAGQEAAQAAGDAGILATIAGLVFLVLTLGFLVSAIGVFTDQEWGWSLMGGTWALNFVFSIVQLLGIPAGEVSIDILAIVFLVINIAVLGWIYSNKKQELPIGGGTRQQPMR